ncbi:Virulence-associated protein D [Bacteroidales bacterium Barb6]|nr:Virulence-associated protein D [Bacteroidales bacterium Barb6]
MFAIGFDMVIADLKQHYKGSYNNAYYDINMELYKYGFFRTQGSVYLTESKDMANLFRAVSALKQIGWFKNSVRDIRAFRVGDWSDFTAFIKE